MNQFAESTKSLSFLEWVHEKQIVRMQTRSEWFLSPDFVSKHNGDSGCLSTFRPFEFSSLNVRNVARKDVSSRSEIARRLSWRKHGVRRPSSTSNMYRLMKTNSSLDKNSPLVPLLPHSPSQVCNFFETSAEVGR
ncbi:unnamed protein product [Soboliphyme baturini]|uniref:Uncharacterized protein n=1 Tax=Soboliphyme baturini TaxID=241478 RepID=A0A183IP00_9BILA|nr:unnamed protein product [Soboliphyme baturini]